ncbi:MAG TPA: aldo/keto reductase [Polyangiales bacterium]|nr:aldo/keto reductase [Polyangiales bacterium]
MSAQLGHSGVRISRVVLGCMFPARLRQPDVEHIVHAAYDAGITSFDTAPLYDFHRGEEQLGRALRDRWQRVQILTKAGLRWDGTHGRELFSFTDSRGRRRVVRRDSRPESLRDEVRQSLLRLGADSVDLMQLHHPDEDTPIAQSIEVLQDLVRAGQIRAYGVSNFDAQQLEEACAAGGGATDAAGSRVASLQSEYNLLQRWPEGELLPLCLDRGVGFLAYSPLAKGVLAGHSRLRSSAERRSSRGSHYDDAVARLALRPALSGTLDALAQAYGRSPAQLALSWLLAQPGVSGVVVGASSVAQVQELALAAEVRLPQQDVDALSSAFAHAGFWLKVADRVRGSVLGRVVRRVAD